jgi:hypothetical protein
MRRESWYLERFPIPRFFKRNTFSPHIDVAREVRYIYPGTYEATDTSRPDVFEFSDFREFLGAYHDYLRKLDPKYSHRLISYEDGAACSG